VNCGFTLTHYKECIELARDSGYTIIPVKDFDKQKKVILLRHDIDFSLEYAYELANFEYDLGINSSYYVYLHSPTYNALSPKSMGMIKAMKGMGHEIGLHYDSRYDLGYSEKDIIPTIIKDDVKSMTQHFPAATLPMYYQDIIDPITLKIKYISDSGRNWREGCMCNHIGKGNLHINTHAEWWVTNSQSREDMIRILYESQHATLQKDVEGIREMLSDYERDVINK
jgi:hypothetical protein